VLSVAHRSRPAAGETACGDLAYSRHESGAWLLAVVDALGHGPSAAEAAELARAFLDHASLERTSAQLMLALHDALKGSRGAAAVLLVARDRAFDCCSVGNVSVRAHATRPMVIPNAGIVGFRIPEMRSTEFEIPAGARIALASDGISGKLDLAASVHLEPERACEWALDRFAIARDDATILIADVVERPDA
jgi:negative regulator of sigma-B (phosphoserine phosphatase)